jgi:hypothetical protein
VDFAWLGPSPFAEVWASLWRHVVNLWVAFLQPPGLSGWTRKTTLRKALRTSASGESRHWVDRHSDPNYKGGPAPGGCWSMLAATSAEETSNKRLKTMDQTTGLNWTEKLCCNPRAELHVHLHVFTIYPPTPLWISLGDIATNLKNRSYWMNCILNMHLFIHCFMSPISFICVCFSLH